MGSQVCPWPAWCHVQPGSGCQRRSRAWAGPASTPASTFQSEPRDHNEGCRSAPHGLPHRRLSPMRPGLALLRAVRGPRRRRSWTNKRMPHAGDRVHRGGQARGQLSTEDVSLALLLLLPFLTHALLSLSPACLVSSLVLSLFSAAFLRLSSPAPPDAVTKLRTWG